MDDDDWLELPQHNQGSSKDPIVNQEYQRIATRYHDAGYREGITDGKLSKLQEGFDQSFAQSVPLSRAIGNLRGKTNALLSYSLLRQKQSRDLSSSHDVEGVISDLRQLIRDLGLIRRKDILPKDLEREEHEKEEHGYELDQSMERDMEDLEDLMGGMNGTSKTPDQSNNGGEKLRALEERFEAIRNMVMRI